MNSDYHVNSCNSVPQKPFVVTLKLTEGKVITNYFTDRATMAAAIKDIVENGYTHGSKLYPVSLHIDAFNGEWRVV